MCSMGSPAVCEVNQDDFQAVVESYKALVRQQDEELRQLKSQVESHGSSASSQDAVNGHPVTLKDEAKGRVMEQQLTAEKMQTALLQKQLAELSEKLETAESSRAESEEACSKIQEDLKFIIPEKCTSCF